MRVTLSNTLSICVVSQQFGAIVSGIGLHAWNLSHALARDGHRVTVVIPRSQKPLQVKADIEFVLTPDPVLKANQARWLSVALHFGQTLCQLEVNRHFDVVQFTDAREALFALNGRAPRMGHVNDYYAAEVKSVPWAYQKHYNDWLARWLYYQFVFACEKYTLPRLAAVVANSHYTADAVRRAYGVPDEQLFVCYKSVEASAYVTAQQTGPTAPRSPVVMFVAGNMQRKGMATLVRAAPWVIAEQPEVEFRVVGRDAHESEMRALCARQGVSEHFNFMGWQPHDKLASLYAEANVFVMPSLMEAFGVVFLEAMAAGVPVIGSNVGGITELIRDEENGLLARVDDAEHLAQQINRLLGDSALSRRLIAGGHNTAQQFTVQRMMECTYCIYDEVLARSPASRASRSLSD
jgi:glycosyltransferase involved in cell wall biosynthesis